MKSWLEISSERLAANYRLLAETEGSETSVLAVVKANAYGHGAEICAPVLASAGAGWLGVTDATEGRLVRAALHTAGIPEEHQPHILVMSESLDEDTEVILQHRLAPVVSSAAQLQALAHKAGNRKVRVHLEIDTGMSRQGVAPGNHLDQVLRWLEQQSAVHLDGVMTHFASSEVAGSHQTAQQRRLFEQAMEQIAASSLRPVWIHAGNSSTIDNHDAPSEDGWLVTLAHSVGARAMVRSGLALYGYALPIERERGYTGLAEPRVQPRLLPVLTWKARVTGIREIEAGTRVGYNGTFTSERPMRLALLPVGYADGLRRELSGTQEHPGGWVLLHGQRAPIVGRVSMNLTIVDATAIPAVAVGDEAIVLGEGITAEDHARLAETISYEILCGMKETRMLR